MMSTVSEKTKALHSKAARDARAKKKGFDSHNEYLNHLAKEKGFDSHNEYLKYFAKSKGFASYNEYQVYKVREKGFDSIVAYRKRNGPVKPKMSLDSIRAKYGIKEPA